MLFKLRITHARLASSSRFILFTYYNPVLQYGLERFFQLVIEKGISGLIIPDLPIEEDSEVRAMAEEANIHLIPLVAPTSNDRVARIASKARGFVYCVSSLGVTGVRADFHKGIEEFLSTVRGATSLPIAVGFGISSREQVQRFEKLADGVIVGVRLSAKSKRLCRCCNPQTRSRTDLLKFASLLKR